MNDPFQDDRLSAYLDGELSDQECAELEAELAADPARLQVVEELRSLSATLGALPRQTLGDDFRDEVLRRAERALLATPGERKPSGTIAADAASTGSGSPGPIPASGDQPGERSVDRPIVPFGYSRRGWVWASLAVAAALFLIIALNRQDQFGVDVAKFQPLPPVESKPTAPAESATIAAADKTEESASEPPEALAAKGGREIDELAESRAKLGPTPKSAAKVAKSAAKAGASSSLESLDADAESGLAYRSGPSGASRWELATKAGKKADNLPEATSRVMVVHVDIVPQAVETKRFNKVLLSNGIQCDAEEKYGINSAGMLAKGSIQEDFKKLPDTPYSSRNAGSSERARRIAARGVGQAANEDVLLICADYRQVAGALAQLQQESKDFPAVQIDPAPAVPAQQSLAQYTRGRVTNSLVASDDEGYAQGGRQSPVAADKLGVTPPLVPQEQSAAGAPTQTVEPSQVAQAPVPQGLPSKAAVQLQKDLPQRAAENAPQLAEQGKREVEAEVGQEKKDRGQVELQVQEEEQLFRYFADAPADSAGQEAVARAERVAPTKRPLAEQLIQQRRLENRSQQLSQQVSDQRLALPQQDQRTNQSPDRVDRNVLRHDQSARASTLRAKDGAVRDQDEGQPVPAARQSVEPPTPAGTGPLADEPMQVLFVLNVVPQPSAAEKASTEVVTPRTGEAKPKD